MLEKVVRRRGDHLPETLLLQATFERLRRDPLHPMAKEDAVYSRPSWPRKRPATGRGASTRPSGWPQQPVSVMEAEHDLAGEALATIRQLT